MAGKDKPGEWTMALGFGALLLCAFFGGSTLFEFMPKYAALRDHGMVADGVVMDKLVETSTRRKGRKRESYVLMVGYNPNNARPYNLSAESDEDTPTTLPPAAPAKALTGDEIVANIAGIMDEVLSTPAFSHSYRMGVSQEEYEATAIGTRISITFLPEAPSQSQLTEDVRSYSPVGPLAGAIVFLILGVWGLVHGFKKRAAYMAGLKAYSLKT